MKKVSIPVYSFSELSRKAQEKAIEEHRRFLLSVMSPDDFISGDPSYDTPEQLQKWYSLEYDYYLFDDSPIIESIETNDYLFFSDGKFIPVE